MRVLFTAALLPPLYLIWRIYKLDKIEKEPFQLLAAIFILGAVSVIPAIILETAFERWILDPIAERSRRWNEYQVIGYYLLENFLGVALIEECCKYAVLKKTTWRSPSFDYRFDGIVYGAVASLGFAAAENVEYVMSYGLGTAGIRAITSIPGHCIFGIIMGYFYALAKRFELDQNVAASKTMRLMSILVPLMIHGLYDFMLSFESSTATMLFYGFVIVLDIFAIWFTRKLSREDERL